MKAQVSSEFMVVYSALLIIFVVVFTIYVGGSINLSQTTESVAAERNAQAAAAAMNYVYLAGDGASYAFTLANRENEENISISCYAVSSERPYVYASAPLLDAKVNVSSLCRGDVMITNNKGELDIG